MAHVIKDFFTGTMLVIGGVFLSLVAVVVLFILGLFFHVVGILATGVFFLFLLFFSIWVVGFFYRKIKEMKGK